MARTMTNTGIRLKPDVWGRLKIAAIERDLSMNYLAGKAIEEFLDRLIPVEEFSLTRPYASSTPVARSPEFGMCTWCGRTFGDIEDHREWCTEQPKSPAPPPLPDLCGGAVMVDQSKANTEVPQ